MKVFSQLEIARLQKLAEELRAMSEEVLQLTGAARNNGKALVLMEALRVESRDDMLLEHIVALVTQHFKVTRRELMSNRRPQEIVDARHTAFWLARQLTQKSLTSVGEYFGGKDHGTVLTACRGVENRRETEKGFAKRTDALLAILKQ